MGRGQIVYNLGKKRFCQLLDHMGACLVKNLINFFCVCYSWYYSES